MALTQISTQGIKDGTITGTDLATNIDLVDNQKLRLGTGNDLQIYHDVYNSKIKDVGTGTLDICSSVLQVKNSGDNELCATFTENGAVKLYHDNSLKFQTNINGCRFIGMLAGIDNEKVALGTGNDLQLYHDGSQSYIVNATSDLRIRSGYVKLQGANGENMLVGNQNTSVELYYDNSKKFETTSYGNHFNGNLRCDDGSYIQVGSSQDLQIYHDGSNSYLADSGTGALVLLASTFALKNAANSENIISGFENGAVELYYDNSKKLSTRSDGIEIHAPEGGEAGLYLTADEGDDTNDKYRLIAQDSGDLVFQRHTGSAYSSELRLKSAGGIQANFQGSNKFETTSAGVAVTGQVTIPDGSATGNRLAIGDSQDLALYHNGSNSFIADRGTGPLYIRGNNAVRIESWTSDSSGEAMIIANSDGAVDLYYNNVKQFETTSTGAKVSGRFEQFGNSTGNNETNSGFARNVYNVPISSGTSKTFTFTGLNGGWATIKMAGYSSNGGSAMSFRAELGGWMFYTSTSNYGSDEPQNHQHNVSTSVTKNATSYVVVVTNNSSTNTEMGLNLCTEATQTAFAVAIS